MRRLFALLIALAVLHAGPAAAKSPTFRSSSEGSPASTLLGTWTESEDGRNVLLQIGGGQVLGAGTKFTAAWETPWTSRGKRPRFDGTFNFESFNNLGESYRLNWEIRYRARGKKWSPWLRHSFGFREGTFSGTGGGSAFGSFSRESYRFQWKLTGKITKPTTLMGAVDLRVN